jgi:hypothetical protein
VLADPLLIGDITGNGRLNASDASRVARVAALLQVPEIPAIPPGLVRAPTGGPDPAYRLPRALAADPGGTVRVPVHIESSFDLQAPHRLAEADAVILFDSDVLTATSVTAGNFITSNSAWNYTANIDNALGRIVIVALGTEPVAGTFADVLVDIDFTVNAGATSGTTALNLVPSSEGAHTDLVSESDESLPFDAPVTHGTTDPADGFLTIRGNAAQQAPLDAAGSIPTKLLVSNAATDRQSFHGPVQDIALLSGTPIDVTHNLKTVEGPTPTRGESGIDRQSLDELLSEEESLGELLELV